VLIRCGRRLQRPKSVTDFENRFAYERINCDAWSRCSLVTWAGNDSIKHCTCNISTSFVSSMGEQIDDAGSAVAMYWPAMIECGD
jgi:hypothetical protein